MKKKIADYFECDDYTAHELMERNVPIKAIHPVYHPQGVPVKWININNHTCMVKTGSTSAIMYDCEDVIFEYPIYEGQETAF